MAKKRERKLTITQQIMQVAIEKLSKYQILVQQKKEEIRIAEEKRIAETEFYMDLLMEQQEQM